MNIDIKKYVDNVYSVGKTPKDAVTNFCLVQDEQEQYNVVEEKDKLLPHYDFNIDSKNHWKAKFKFGGEQYQCSGTIMKFPFSDDKYYLMTYVNKLDK